MLHSEKIHRIVRGILIAIGLASILIVSVAIPAQFTDNNWVIAPMAFIVFELVLTIALTTTNTIVIRSKGEEARRDEEIKKQAKQEAERAFAQIVVDTARQYPAITTESLKGKLASLQEAHPNDVGNIFCDLIAYLCRDSSAFLNSLDKATTELEQAKTANTQLETRVSNLSERCGELATTNESLNQKLNRVDASMRYLLGCIGYVMQALLNLKPESATGEQIREIRIELGAFVLYSSMRAGHQPYLTDEQILLMGESATHLLHQFDLERAGNRGTGQFDPRQIETLENRPIEAITAIVARYGVLRQAKRSAAIQQT